MNEQQLSKRLATVASYVQNGRLLADIGSDHAYLPCYLAIHNKIQKGIAGEVVDGPYQSAQRQVEMVNLKDKIEVRLGDGLEVIFPEKEAVSEYTICGMGGSLIASILENGKQKGKLVGTERLILQPNVGEASLRNWLQQNSYEIIEEEIIEEDQKIYEIIVAEKSDKTVEYKQKQLMFGPKLLSQNNPIFQKKWTNELQNKERILDNLSRAQQKQLDKVKHFEQEIKWIKEVLRE